MNENKQMTRIYNIPSHYSFIDVLAQGLSNKYQKYPLKLSKYSIFLPSYDDCKEFQRCLIYYSKKQKLLMPRILLLERSKATLHNQFMKIITLNNPPPVINTKKRQALLTKVVLNNINKYNNFKEPLTPTNAFKMAQNLMYFLDEIQISNFDYKKLFGKIPNQISNIINIWSDIIKYSKEIEAHQYHAMASKLLTIHWKQNPPLDPVIAAGFNECNPTTLHLLKNIYMLKKGYIIIPGFDKSIYNVPHSHPLYAHKKFLKKFNLRNNQVKIWPHLKICQPSGNLRHAKIFLNSIKIKPKKINKNKKINIKIIECDNNQEEAIAVALKIREEITLSKKNISLVSPNKNLFKIVKYELKRWNIYCDHKEKSLKDTIHGELILILLKVTMNPYEPNSLLALLKHPIIYKKNQSSWIKELETKILRNTKLAKGINPLINASLRYKNTTNQLIKLNNILSPLIKTLQQKYTSLPNVISTIIIVYKNIVYKKDQTWSQIIEEKIINFFTEIKNNYSYFNKIKSKDVYEFFVTILKNYIYSNKTKHNIHLSFLDPKEARIRQTTVTIISNLNEEIWTEKKIEDWIGLIKRNKLGLISQEERIGISAHNFYQIFSGNKVILTRSKRNEGNKTIPNKWLKNIINNIQNSEIKLIFCKKTLDIIKNIEQSYKCNVPSYKAPQPYPKIEYRLKTALSTNQITILMNDPYSFYVKYILKINPIKDVISLIVASINQKIIFHKALEEFIKKNIKTSKNEAYKNLLDIGKKLFQSINHHIESKIFWWHKFQKISKWFINQQKILSPIKSWTKIKKTSNIKINEDLFRITADADRIDFFKTEYFNIINYKITKPQKIKQKLINKLSLEELIFNKSNNFFKKKKKYSLNNLTLWWLKGENNEGKIEIINNNMQKIINQNLKDIKNIIKYYNNQCIPYTKKQHQNIKNIYFQYTSIK